MKIIIYQSIVPQVLQEKRPFRFQLQVVSTYVKCNTRYIESIKSRKSVKQRPRGGPNNELMRAFEDARSINLDDSSSFSSSDDSSIERARRLNDHTMIAGMPWSELKQKLGKKIHMSKLLESLDENEAATLKELKAL